MAKYDYFISYSSKDEDIAFRIVNALESAGYSCWIAPRNIPYGTPYARAIMEGIDESDRFIVLITKHSIASSDVLNEVDNAHSAKKTIIPVRLTDTSLSRELNYYLSRTQWLTLPASKPEEIVKLLNIGYNASYSNRASTMKPSGAGARKRMTMMWVITAIIMLGAIVTVWYVPSQKSKDKDADYDPTISMDNVSQFDNPSDETQIADTLQSKIMNTAQSETTKKEPAKKTPAEQSVKENRPSQSDPKDYKHMLFEANTYYINNKYEEALPLYIEIADSFDTNHAHKVGYMYEHGLGTAANVDKAIEWYKKAADFGNIHAQNDLALLYLKGGDYDNAAYHYLNAEKDGNLSPMSQNNLGWLYYNGLGVPKDLEKAKNNWREATKRGDKLAQSNLEKYFSE